jgi:5-methylcytosine-specific restriction endonuclease McrA
MRDQKEINKKISKALKGRPSWSEGSFKPGHDPRRIHWTEEHRTKGHDTQRNRRTKLYSECPWIELPKPEKRRRIIQEQDGKCLWCGICDWREIKLTLELDHIDGNNKNDERDNLRILCPNCHSQTPTFRNMRRCDAMQT